MLPFVLRRTGYMLITVLLVTIAVYVIFSVLPFDPAALTCGKNCTPAVISANRHRLGYDQPLWTQYWNFIQGLWNGRDYGQGQAAFRCPPPALGYSFNKHMCVSAMIQRAFPATLGLAIGAETLFLTMGIGLGILAARNRGRIADRGATLFVLLGTSLPAFFIGLLLLLFFSVKLGWFPNTTTGSGFVPITKDPIQYIRIMVLPWFTLAVVSAAIYTRYTRAQVLEIGTEDFVRTARAKGLSSKAVMRKHILRVALAPLVTLAALDFAGLLGGAVFTESIFGLPGMGRLTIQSVNNFDLPVITALTLIGAVLVVVANLVVDILYAVIDPRVRSVK